MFFRVPCLSSLAHSVFLAHPDVDGHATHSHHHTHHGHVAIHGHENSKPCNADDSSAMSLRGAKNDAVSMLLMPDAAELISENEFNHHNHQYFSRPCEGSLFPGRHMENHGAGRSNAAFVLFSSHRLNFPRKNHLIYIRLHPSGVVRLKEEAVD